MTENEFRLVNPPIIEAIVDIDCDLPPAFALSAEEARVREAYRDRYPKFRPQLIAEHELQSMEDGSLPMFAARTGLHAFQFFSEDERQLVQIRSQGFSFNRLAPYLRFDDYLPEIERTWKTYRELVDPMQIRAVRLQFINRIPLPMDQGNLNLDRYFDRGPKVPDAGLPLRRIFGSTRGRRPGHRKPSHHHPDDSTVRQRRSPGDFPHRSRSGPAARPAGLGLDS